MLSGGKIHFQLIHSLFLYFDTVLREFFSVPFRPVFLGDPNIEVLDRGQQLKIKSARLGDQARYQCSATNAAGKQSKDFNLSIFGNYSYIMSYYGFYNNRIKSSKC